MAAALRLGYAAHLRVGCPGLGRQVKALHTRPRALSNDDDRAREEARLRDAHAMQEALDLYREAQEMAQRQVLQELMQMEISDMSYYQEGPAAGQPTTAADVPAAAQPLQQPAAASPSSAKQAAPAPGSIRREPLSPAALCTQLQSFWLEQGLPAQHAHRIAREMVGSNSPWCDVTRLATQIQRLSRVIPGPVQEMVARDWKILDAGPSTVAQHYVQLVQLFPDALDISQLAVKQPKLLYCDNLVGQFEQVVDKLVQLHPSHSREEARAMLADYPELLFRMPYYMHARTLDELPMELQNIMVYTGQGLHHLHQLYSDSISPRFL